MLAARAHPVPTQSFACTFDRSLSALGIVVNERAHGGELSELSQAVGKHDDDEGALLV
jgi:hypothetical protein